LVRLDVHHTDVGGSAIDLGGFRQYVHRGQLNKRVEWGAELKVAALSDPKHQRLAQLLAPVSTIALNISVGMELDDQDRPKVGAAPRVDSIEISGDGSELLRMSRRLSSIRPDAQSGHLRLDRLASDHAVFRQVLKAIVEAQTTSEEIRPEDFAGADEAIAALLPELVVRVDQFFPSGVELPKGEGREVSPATMLFPVSKGNRREDIAQAVRFVLPRTLSDLIKGLSDALADELSQLQYLGPLRSFPPRHLAFAEHEDANWYAGGGYAWDVVRRDDAVRESVNKWLGSSKLKTPYKLVVRSLVALDQLHGPLEQGLERLEGEGLDIEAEPESRYTMGGYAPVISDIPAAAADLVASLDASDADRLRELVLLDQRTNVVVTHRDVGIGISQVLPVLVMAYGSRGKLLAMEQPEIHLHPALQAELGDVFVESALGDRTNTFLLETHSEHLILRLLRRIRETHEGGLADGLAPLTPADVAVLFVRPTPSGSEVRELFISEDGDIPDGWPDGFFDERAKELF